MKIYRAVRRAFFLVGMAGWATLPLSVVAADDLGNGQRLYRAQCAGCHGLNGLSVMEKAPDLARFDLLSKPDEALIEVIRSGLNEMPPYFGVLGDQDILDVVNYIRTLY